MEANNDVPQGDKDFHKSVCGPRDVITTNIIGRWWKNRMVHTAIGFSLKFPVGDYKEDRELNIGENRYVLYIPCLYLQCRYPLGKGMLFLDYAMGMEWKYKNSDTHYNVG